MARVYNFSAGAAVLPEEVLRQAAAEMLDYDGTGMSVMEMSHRSKPFAEIIETAEADLRELMQHSRQLPACCSCRAAPPSSSPPSP